MVTRVSRAGDAAKAQVVGTPVGTSAARRSGRSAPQLLAAALAPDRDNPGDDPRLPRFGLGARVCREPGVRACPVFWLPVTLALGALRNAEEALLCLLVCCYPG
jgi:hypothetical protein